MQLLLTNENLINRLVTDDSDILNTKLDSTNQRYFNIIISLLNNN